MIQQPRPWLNDDELQELTGYQRRGHQCRVLRELGIKFRQRHDRFPVVLRSDLGAPIDTGRQRGADGPNMDAIRSRA